MSQRESILDFKSPDDRQNFMLFGFNDHDFLMGAADADQEYYCIEAWGGAADVDYTVTNLQNETTDKVGIAMTEGARIFGRLSAVTVNSGEVLAYKLNILPA